MYGQTTQRELSVRIGGILNYTVRCDFGIVPTRSNIYTHTMGIALTFLTFLTLNDSSLCAHCTLQNSYRKPWKLFCLKNWFLSTLELLLYELIKITELRFLNIAQPLMAFWRLKIELEPRYYGNELNSISFEMCQNVSQSPWTNEENHIIENIWIYCWFLKWHLKTKYYEWYFQYNLSWCWHLYGSVRFQSFTTSSNLRSCSLTMNMGSGKVLFVPFNTIKMHHHSTDMDKSVRS